MVDTGKLTGHMFDVLTNLLKVMVKVLLLGVLVVLEKQWWCMRSNSGRPSVKRLAVWSTLRTTSDIEKSV